MSVFMLIISPGRVLLEAPPLLRKVLLLVAEMSAGFASVEPA